LQNHHSRGRHPSRGLFWKLIELVANPRRTKPPSAPLTPSPPALDAARTRHVHEWSNPSQGCADGTNGDPRGLLAPPYRHPPQEIDSPCVQTLADAVADVITSVAPEPWRPPALLPTSSLAAYLGPKRKGGIDGQRPIENASSMNQRTKAPQKQRVGAPFRHESIVARVLFRSEGGAASSSTQDGQSARGRSQKAGPSQEERLFLSMAAIGRRPNSW